MLRTAGVEFTIAGRTSRITGEVFIDREPAAAGAAKDGRRVSLVRRPNLCLVIGDLAVALVTWKPPITAFKPYSDNVELAVVMSAASLRIDFQTVNSFAMDRALFMHVRLVRRSASSPVR